LFILPFVWTERLTCSHHQTLFLSLETSIPVARVHVYVQAVQRVFAYVCEMRGNATSRRVGRTERHIIRGNWRMRGWHATLGIIHNYRVPTPSTACHCRWSDGDPSTRLFESCANLYATPRRGCIQDPPARRGAYPSPRPGILLRGDGDRRCVCEVNDIFQSAGVSLVLGSFSFLLFLSSFFANSRSFG